MGVSMDWSEEIEFCTGRYLITVPTPLNVLLLSTLPDLAERGAASCSTTFSTAKLHHRAEDLVALVIVFEAFSEGVSGDELGEFVVAGFAEFFSEISG